MDPRALQKIIYGMFIVGSRKDTALNAQLANTVVQVCAEPPIIAVSIARQNLTHEFIQSSGVFSVSVLSTEAPLTFIGLFGFKSGRSVDKFREMDYTPGSTGAPVVLRHAVAWLEAEVINSVDTPTHTLFLGKVVASEIVDETAEPMSYDYYHKIKGGFTPKNAPTYAKKETNEKGVAAVKKFKCSVCGSIYNPDKGDPERGIKPGTPFEKLPENWTCPVCGAPKTEFVPIE